MLLIICIFSPLVGYFVDKFGKRTYMYILAFIFAISSFLIFKLFSENLSLIIPIIGSFLLGISMTFLLTTMWPSVILITKNNATGTAIGLITSFLNLGSSIGSLIIGKIIKN